MPRVTESVPIKFIFVALGTTRVMIGVEMSVKFSLDSFRMNVLVVIVTVMRAIKLALMKFPWCQCLSAFFVFIDNSGC